MRVAKLRKRILRPRRPVYLGEPLERRTYLDFTINGTPGNDTIIISADSNNITYSLNGVVTTIANPSDHNCNVLGNAGNDSIWLKTTGVDTWALTGNAGDNSFHVGDGDLNAQIGAQVQVDEVAGAGNGGHDSLLIDDSVGGTDGNRYYLDAAELQIKNIGDDPLPPIIFNMLPGATVSLLGSEGDDSLFVDGIRQNMNVNLGAGDDYVNLSDNDATVPPTVPGVLIDGGGEGDRVVFSEYGQQANFGANTISDNTIDGFGIKGFQSMVIYDVDQTQGTTGFLGSDTTFTGSHAPAFSATIQGDNYDDQVNFGTSTSPLTDAEEYIGAVTLDLRGGTNTVSVYDGDNHAGDTPNWRIQGPNIFTDPVSPSAFSLNSTGATNFFINGGPEADQFDLAFVPLNWNLHLNGGGGNDFYSEYGGEAGYPNSGHNGDIDAIIVGGVTLDGGGQNDLLSLDDSNDQIGDADEYRITGSAFTKGDFGAAQVQYFAYTNLASISLLADSDPNTIRVYAATNLTSVTLNGGGGNDTFLDTNPSTGSGSLDGNPLTTTIIAGPGTDFLGLDDSFNQTISEYDMTATSVSAHDTRDNSTRTLNFDSTLESMELDESSGGTLTKLLGKTQGMAVTVNADDGNDTVIAGGGDVDSNGFSQNNTTINGGTGTDSIEFDDHLDNTAPSQVDVYTMNSTTFGKGGSAMLFYTGFEAQRVDGSDDVPKLQFAKANEFDINAVSILIASTTIIGANSRPSTVILSLPNLGGALTLTLGTGLSDIVTVNDQTSSANKDYTLSSTALTTSTGQVVNYSGVEQFTLNASAGNSTITIGNGNVDTDIPFPVTINGGGGTDQLLFENNLDASVESQSLDAGAFTDNQVYSFSAVESLFFDEGPGGEMINLNKIQIPTTVQGRGNDIVNIGAGDLTDNWLANVSVIGNFGNDVLTIDDHLGLSGAATYQWDTGDQFHASNIFREPTLGSQTITATTVGSRVLLANDANDIINVNSTSTGLSVYGNGGNDQINIFDSDGPVGVDTGSEGLSLIAPFGDYLNVNSDAGTSGDSGASVKLLNSDDVYSVVVNAAPNTLGTLQIPTGSTLNITHDLTLSGVIDMAGGAMAVDNGATQISLFSTWIKNGRKNNTWTGTSSADGTGGAINSSLAALTPNSTAVGFAPGSALFTTFSSTFFGKTVFQTTMLVRYTTLGDATLSAKTNALDFNAVATNFGKPSVNWYQGDFNYDGSVNTADFVLLASQFNAAVASQPIDSVPLAVRADAGPSLFSGQTIADASGDPDVLASTWSVL